MRNALLLRGGLTVLTTLLADTVNAVTYDSTICGKDKFTSGNGDFIFGANAWNPVGDDGFQCMSIQEGVPAFDATWKWDADPSDVHSYPHVRFMSDKLPTPLSTIKSMRLKTQWTMTPGNPGDSPPRVFDNATWTTDKAEVSRLGVVANAAWDFFADPNKTNTYNPVDADTEIMIWLGLVGNPFPLKGPSILTTIKLGEAEFELNYAKNFRGHNVFTWVTTVGDITTFDEDVTPLFQYIYDSNLISKDSWLGLVEFGSETWYAPSNITFSVANFGMDLDNGDFGDKGSSGGSGDTDGDGDDDSKDDKNAAGAIGVSAVALVAPVLALVALCGW